jgi:hypothetical protein
MKLEETAGAGKPASSVLAVSHPRIQYLQSPINENLKPPYKGFNNKYDDYVSEGYWLRTAM